MPAVLSTHYLGDRSDKHCRKCDQDIPSSDQHWDAVARLCRRCASARPLTIRLPAGQPCSLCEACFPPSVYLAGSGNAPHTRCTRCRVRERCTRCSKIKKRRRFLKPGVRNSENSHRMLSNLDCCLCLSMSAGTAEFPGCRARDRATS